MKRNATRQCPAKGCETRIAEGHLMCATHWRLVPATVAQAVNTAWARYKKLPTLERARTLTAVQLVAVDKVNRTLRDV